MAFVPHRTKLGLVIVVDGKTGTCKSCAAVPDGRWFKVKIDFGNGATPASYSFNASGVGQWPLQHWSLVPRGEDVEAYAARMREAYIASEQANAALEESKKREPSRKVRKAESQPAQGSLFDVGTRTRR